MSAMTTFPDESTTTLVGLFNVALVAAIPSVKEATPVPANVLMMLEHPE